MMILGACYASCFTRFGNQLDQRDNVGHLQKKRVGSGLVLPFKRTIFLNQLPQLPRCLNQGSVFDVFCL